MKAVNMKWLLALVLMGVSSLNADVTMKENEVKITTTDKPLPVYYNRMNFNLSRLGYERIRNDAMYFGIEAWYLLTFGPIPFERTIGEAEARVGYNFFFHEDDRFTPIVGVGYFKEFVHHHKQGIIYGTIGVLYEHRFSNLFDLGVNLKLLVGGDQGRHRWGSPVWGYDISAPLTFHFGERRNWDFRLEPFYIQMFAHNNTHNFGGGRSAFGYRF
jgi:hypothetical protein